MRKFLTIGLSTLATASMALGVAAGPASAASTVLTDAVCASLPAQQLAGVNALASATLTQTTAAADLVLKTTDFLTAQGGFATAVVAYVVAVDAGTPLPGVTQTVYDTLGVYSTKLAAWSNAANAKDAADKAVTMAGVNNTILNGIDTGLLCP